MKKSEIKNLVRSIYSIIAESGLTSHKFSDDDWRMIYEVRNTINRYLLKKELPYSCILFSSSYNTEMTAKYYSLSIEDIFTAKSIIGGEVTACAAGTIENNWSSYDVCVNFWIK